MFKRISGLTSTAVAPLVSRGFQGARYTLMGVLIVSLLSVLVFSSTMSTFFAVKDMKGNYYRAYTCEVEEIMDILKIRGPSVMFLEDCPFSFESSQQKSPVNFLGLKLPAMGPFIRAEYKLLRTSEDKRGFLHSKHVSTRRMTYSVAALNAAAAEGRTATLREVWGAPIDVGPFLVAGSIFHSHYSYSNLGKSEVVLQPNTEATLRESPFFGGLNVTATRFLPHQAGYDNGAQLFFHFRDDAKGVKNSPKLKLDDKQMALRLSTINLGLLPSRLHTVFGLFIIDEATQRPMLVPYMPASKKNLAKAALKEEDRYYSKFDPHPITGIGAPEINHRGTVVLSPGVAPGVPSPNHAWMMSYDPLMRMVIPLSCLVGGWVLVAFLNIKAYLAVSAKGADRSGLAVRQRFMPELMVAGEVLGSALLLWVILYAGRGGFGAFIISVITLAAAAGLFFAPMNKWPEAPEKDEKEALLK